MIARFNGNVVPFADDSTSTNRTVFGGTTQSDLIDDNLNTNFKKGWEIVGLNDNPTREDFNAMGYTLGALTAYLYEMGISEWNASQKYRANSIVMASDGNLYKSLTGTSGTPNVGNNPLSDVVNWKSLEAVSLTGNQTIAGVKTFTSSPIVPTPTTSTQSANKAYVDSKTLNINSLSNKPTPLDTDNFALQEVGGDLKKVSYKNLFDKVSITGSATFNGTTQTIDLIGAGDITLAIGDVIEVTGTTSNNKLFTVESIPSANQIIVNYEHRGTLTPIPNKRLINETATATVTLYNRAKNAPLGQGQGWVKTPMSAAEIRQNLTGRTISWLCGVDNAYAPSQISPDGTNWIDTAFAQGTTRYMMAIEVPNGYYFKITTDPTVCLRVCQLR